LFFAYAPTRGPLEGCSAQGYKGKEKTKTF
jgi:hypothetical protein